MRVLVAHQSPLSLARLRRLVCSSIGGVTCFDAQSLTDVYNLAEHREPDLVVVGNGLAAQPEFELLASLMRLMKIRCVITTSDAIKTTIHPQYGDIRIVPEPALADELDFSGHTGRIASKPPLKEPVQPASAPWDQKHVILVGASTGGIDALLTLTRSFDAHSPPVVIVQHTGGAFAKSLIRLLDGASPAQVIDATHETPVKSGHIYLPPDDQAHLTLMPGRPVRLALQAGPPVSGHRPSVDALFKSALPFAAHVTAALLTGMGKDGAAGMVALRHAGAQTIAQDRQTSVVYGMPRVAFEMGGVCTQLPIQKIGPALMAASRLRRSA